MYGKEYRIIGNFREYDDEEAFDIQLEELCKRHNMIRLRKNENGLWS